MPQRNRIAIPGSELPDISEARAIGVADPDEQIEVRVLLRYPPSGPGAPSVEEPEARRPKRSSRKEFEDLYGAREDDVEKVKVFAHQHGLHVKNVKISQRMISLSGTIAALNVAFGVSLAQYDHEDGSFRGYEGPISVPAELSSIVQGVFGLDNRQAFKPHIRLSAPHESSGSQSIPEGALLPTQVARIYNFPTDVTGAGESIAIIELGGGYEYSVLEDYFENVVKLPLPKIECVEVAGGSNDPYGYGADEVYLDIEIAGSVAPGAEIVVYFAPGHGMLEAIKQATHDSVKQHSVISISYGRSEAKVSGMHRQAINQALREAALLGITVCISAGDHGSGNGDFDGLAHAVFPASSPYALACTGTKVTAQGTEIKEVVWNDNDGWATGGGVSAFFACPSYQEKAGICPRSLNPDAGTGRGVADVAGHADMKTGYYVYAPEAVRAGGTSAVAPLWAGLIACLNQKLNGRVGFINPHLYQIGDSAGAFNDITQGDNNTASQVGGYKARPGWDACTGWGSPNGAGLLKALQDKEF